MNTYDHLRKGVPLIEAQINYTFKEKSLIELAFIHRSFTNENRDIVEGHNERLEFLGEKSSILFILFAGPFLIFSSLDNGFEDDFLSPEFLVDGFIS